MNENAALCFFNATLLQKQTNKTDVVQSWSHVVMSSMNCKKKVANIFLRTHNETHSL